MRRVGVWCVVIGLLAGGTHVDHGYTAEEETTPATAADDAAPLPPPANLQEALTRTISLDFQDANLKDVLKLFSQQSGINFIASEEVKERKITMFVDQVTVQDALDQILRSNNLISETMPESNILIIREAGIDGVQTATKIFRLRYARISTSSLAKVVASGGWGVALGSGALTGLSTSSSTGGTGIDQVLTKLLTKDGSLVTDERTNSLIITDVPDNFPKIEQAIAELDVKTPQILIEVELLEVSASRTKNLGIEWGGTLGSVATFTPATGATTRFPLNLFQSAFQTSTDSRRITLGTLNTAQFQAVLKALQSDSDTRVLAHPKVLTLNNEKAVVELISSTAIARQVSTISTGGTGTTTTTAERSPTGVRLQVIPQINADGYITMYVEPVLSRPIASEFFPADFVDPKIRATSTIVRVRAGETIVIGGLIDRTETKGRRKVPGLGNIPLAGAAFRKNDDTYSDTELIVFITPHIADDAMVAAGAQTPLTLPPLAPEQQPPMGQPLVAAREQTMAATLDDLAAPMPSSRP